MVNMERYKIAESVSVNSSAVIIFVYCRRSETQAFVVRRDDIDRQLPQRETISES